MLEWIIDFLIEREQRVVFGNAFSNWSLVNNGIPQGSVPGPLLFMVFVNDLSEIVKNKTKLYAYYSKIFFCYDNLINILILFQDNLNNLILWANDWSLELNLSKWSLEEMHLGKKQKLFLNYTRYRPKSNIFSLESLVKLRTRCGYFKSSFKFLETNHGWRLFTKHPTILHIRRL